LKSLAFTTPLSSGKKISIEHVAQMGFFGLTALRNLLLSLGKAVLRAIPYGIAPLHGICKGATAVKSLAGLGTRHDFVPIQMVDTVDRDRPR